MDNTKYNGWVNRETWLVNLHFGDGILEFLQEDVDNENIDKDTSYSNLSEMIQDFVEDIIDDEINEVANISSFLSDLIDLGDIDYYEIAKSIENDLYYPEEEEEEE